MSKKKMDLVTGPQPDMGEPFEGEVITVAKRKMNIEEFIEFGYLQKANRRFFHPLGLQLEVRMGLVKLKVLSDEEYIKKAREMFKEVHINDAKEPLLAMSDETILAIRDVRKGVTE